VTTFFDSDFDFPLDERCFEVGIAADKQGVDIGPADFVAADLFNVILVRRIDRFVDLEISEIKINMIVRLPCAH